MMSALVYGRKRSFFEEFPSTSVVSKRVRCSSSPSTSLTRLSPPPAMDQLDRLRSLFPNVEDEVLEMILENSGYILDTAIKGLEDLCLKSAAKSVDDHEPEQTGPSLNKGDGAEGGVGSSAATTRDKHPASDEECWMEFLFREITEAASVDDVKARVQRGLEALEKTINARSREKAAECFRQENTVLKEEIQRLMAENSLLKRAVAIQHGHLQDYESKKQEVDHLRQMVSQCRKQVKILEADNYGLGVRLRAALDGKSFPPYFPPEIC